MRILLIFAVLILTGCTSVPDRYVKEPSISEDGGYIVEAEDDDGFHLDTFFKSYSFAPSPDDNILEAIKYFKDVATKIASKKDREISPIRRSELTVDSTRNVIDANYSIYVSGRVDYVD